jgi:Tfp pilus assembly protein PilX
MSKSFMNRVRQTHLRRSRRGIAAVLVMLYLSLFATLALGFYAGVTTSIRIARNDQHNAKALLAAESGLQFMRYHLANVSIAPDSTTVLNDLYTDLKARLEGTGNFANKTIALSGNTIAIPAESGAYVSLNATDHTGFTASITEWNGNIVCTVTGRGGAADDATSAVSARGVSLDFLRKPIPTTAFDYAVASKGRVAVLKGSITGIAGVSNDSIATIMSARGSSPAVSISGGAIGGDINIVGSGLASVTGGTVGGVSNASDILSNHTHVVPAPHFPVVDTAIFRQYATNIYTGGSSLENVLIPANTNPTFTGNATIQGIMYIESPNTVTFRGNTTLQGFMVFENAGTVSENVIDMRGNFSQGTLPTGSEFDPLRTTTGIAILAPTASMTTSGSVDSTVRGNMILGTFLNSGSGNLQIDQGTLMTLDPGAAATFNGKNVTFTSTGKSNQPSQGLKYDEYYVPVDGSYRELN